DPVFKEIDLRSLCEEVLLKIDIPKTIKSSCKVDSDARQIKADPDLLRRVLGNLVTNSVQAMPEGGKLFIRASRVKKDVLVEVQDTGVGVSEDMKPKLFTPLFTTKSKGQGFGLAVVKRVTEAMNGTVTFESKRGEGTTFSIRLPLPDDNR
ncbi:MAG TPA: ATP-binding protein, partial [Candidatus Bathyarchaeia archaeon]